jgi:hypothetical protein
MILTWRLAEALVEDGRRDEAAMAYPRAPSRFRRWMAAAYYRRSTPVE